MSEKTELAVIEEIPALAKLEDLEPEAVERVNMLFRLMSSQPEGFEEEVRWTPEKLKLLHPVSNDPLAPGDAKVGDIYAAGEILWSAEKDGRTKPFKFVLCYAWQSRSRFMPGDNRPDCSSADGKWNDHGTLMCKDCPDLPFRNGKPTNCNNVLNMVVLPVDLRGVYIVRFSKSSYKAGSNIKKLLKSSLKVWDKTFGLTTKEMSNASNTWNVFQSMPLSEEPAPEVKLFAEYVSGEYAKMREEYLGSLAEMRENASAGLQAMEDGLGDIDDEDGGFEESM